MTMNEENYELFKIKLDKVNNSINVKDDITLEKYISLHKDDYKQPMINSNVDNTPLNYSISGNTKYRVVRDQATDAFVNLTTKNVEIYDLVSFMQDYLHHETLSNINDELGKNFYPMSKYKLDKFIANTKLNDGVENKDNMNNMYPLMNNEDMCYYFKGGTLMKLYKDLFINSSKSTQQKLSPDLKEKLNKYFKVSDVDMNLSIKTPYVFRFNQIKYCSTKILANKLRFLASYFDKIYEEGKKKIPEKSLIYGSEESQKYDFTNHDITVNDVKYNILKLKNQFIYEIKRGTFNFNDLLQDLLEYIGNIGKLMFSKLCSKSVFINSLCIEFLTFIINISKIHSVNLKNITIIQELINTKKNCNEYLINEKCKKINKLFENYEEQFIKDLKERLGELKNTLKGKEIFNYDSSPSIKYKIKDDISGMNIEDDASRGDFAVRDTEFVNSGSLLVEFNSNLYKNYVSYNNTINVFMHNKLLAFSLMRIKHLTKLSNYLVEINNGNDIDKTINIPAELLDISISSPTDGYFFMNKVSKQFEKEYIYYNDKDIIVCDNRKNIMQDLSYILFSQRTSLIPWYDIKYEKRIFRLLFFLKILSKNKDEKINNFYLCFDKLKELLNLIEIDKKKTTNNISVNNTSEYDNLRNTIIINSNIDNNKFDKHIDNTAEFEYINNNFYQINFEYYPLKDLFTYLLFIIDYIIIDSKDSSKKNIFKKCFNRAMEIYNIIGIEEMMDNDFKIYKEKFINFIEDCKNNIEILKSL